jgi:hypothetical protein
VGPCCFKRYWKLEENHITAIQRNRLGNVLLLHVVIVLMHSVLASCGSSVYYQTVRLLATNSCLTNGAATWYCS